MTNPGTKSVCADCGSEIMFIGPYWAHIGNIKPRHIASPKKPNKPNESEKNDFFGDLSSLATHYMKLLDLNNKKKEFEHQKDINAHDLAEEKAFELQMEEAISANVESIRQCLHRIEVCNVRPSLRKNNNVT